MDESDHIEEINTSDYVDINDEVKNARIEEPGYFKSAFYITLGLAIVAKNISRWGSLNFAKY